jgi:hypothetical protein
MDNLSLSLWSVSISSNLSFKSHQSLSQYPSLSLSQSQSQSQSQSYVIHLSMFSCPPNLQFFCPFTLACPKAGL